MSEQANAAHEWSEHMIDDILRENPDTVSSHAKFVAQARRYARLAPKPEELEPVNLVPQYGLNVSKIYNLRTGKTMGHPNQGVLIDASSMFDHQISQ